MPVFLLKLTLHESLFSFYFLSKTTECYQQRKWLGLEVVFRICTVCVHMCVALCCACMVVNSYQGDDVRSGKRFMKFI